MILLEQVALLYPAAQKPEGAMKNKQKQNKISTLLNTTE